MMMRKWSSIAKNCSSRKFSTSKIPQENTSLSFPFLVLFSTFTGFMGYVISDLVQSKIVQRRFMKSVEESSCLRKRSAELKDEVLRKMSG